LGGGGGALVLLGVACGRGDKRLPIGDASVRWGDGDPRDGDRGDADRDGVTRYTSSPCRDSLKKRK